MDKATILLIMPTLFAGGAEKQYRYIMESLSENYQVEVLLLNLPIQGQEAQTVNYIKEHPLICFHQLKGKVFQETQSGIITKWRKVKALLLQWIWLKKRLSTKKIDIAMFSYVTQLLMVPLLGKHYVKTIFNERNTGRQICDRNYKRILLNKCTRVISNSQFAAEYITRCTGISVKVYNNGICSDLISLEKHDGFNILIPARINRIKNQMILIQSLKQLENEGVSSDLCVTLAGDIDDSAYALELANEIKANHLNVRIMGYVEKIKKLYAKSDLIVLPSLEEGTPNVILEAYLYGIRILASDIPMNRNCALDESVLFDPRDSNALSNLIKQIINSEVDSEVEEKQKERNRKYVIDNYGLDAMKNRYTALFDSVYSQEK